MNQPEHILDGGTRIRTHAALKHSDHFGARYPDTPGKIVGVVGGMGGDVYHVEHDHGGKGAYCFDEFEPESKPAPATYATRLPGGAFGSAPHGMTSAAPAGTANTSGSS